MVYRDGNDKGHSGESSQHGKSIRLLLSDWGRKSGGPQLVVKMRLSLLQLHNLTVGDLIVIAITAVFRC